MIGRFVGRLVLVALVVFAAYFVLTHYVGDTSRFGCQSGSAVAQADSPDCPATIDAAAEDARWAADRWPEGQHETFTGRS